MSASSPGSSGAWASRWTSSRARRTRRSHASSPWASARASSTSRQARRRRCRARRSTRTSTSSSTVSTRGGSRAPRSTTSSTPTTGSPASRRASLGLGEHPLLLWVGRLAPIKGLDTLLDAVARLRAAGGAHTLLIVGGEADEPENGHEAALRERIERLGLGAAVRFVGPLPQDVLPTYYVAADVTVLPSYYESFGMVALEAMACGSPVTASRVGGLVTAVP